jgi:hypothetical protein
MVGKNQCIAMALALPVARPVRLSPTTTTRLDSGRPRSGCVRTAAVSEPTRPRSTRRRSGAFFVCDARRTAAAGAVRGMRTPAAMPVAVLIATCGRSIIAIRGDSPTTVDVGNACLQLAGELAQVIGPNGLPFNAEIPAVRPSTTQ